MKLLNTLYVTTEGSYLRIDNDTIVVEVERAVRLRLPLHHIDSVVCFGNVGASTPFIHRLADAGIAMVFLDMNGRFKARIEGAVSGNVLLRQTQYSRSQDAAVCLELARAFVAGKIRNARQVLLRGAREAKDETEAEQISRVADNLAASLRALPDASDLDTVRGIEGEAARQYFGSINQLIRPDARADFQMNGRSRRPPRDRVNAILSFLYSMWMNDCRSGCEACGLDPQVGFLHAVRPGRAALALDLMEEFRPLADRLALTLINRMQVTASDFAEREGGAVLLEGDARKTVVVSYQERKQEEVAHPLLAETVPFGVVPFVQARILARALRGETDGYVPFLIK
jgi:CRISP-associated protein Cas1